MFLLVHLFSHKELELEELTEGICFAINWIRCQTNNPWMRSADLLSLFTKAHPMSLSLVPFKCTENISILFINNFN